jgi:tRNA/tmRNA/rRNA uracil-C5-methylase (TrmA/RlmC/RlmD family)
VARHPDGRVVFVRHGLPGERVRVVLTETNRRFYRAEAVEVLEASPDRVVPPCPFAGPGRCGGCDWQHVSLPAQRRLKAELVAEQLRRLAGLDLKVSVEAVPVDAVPVGLSGPEPPPGLGWRSRVTFSTDSQGRAGFHRWRSREIEAVDRCLIAAPAVEAVGVEARRWPAGTQVEVAVPTGWSQQADRPGPAYAVSVPTGGTGLLPPEGGYVVHRVGHRQFRVGAGGFWQGHSGAATLLVEAVLEGLGPEPGERVADLFSGVGLFTAFLAEAVGPTGSVVAVEGDGGAVEDARHNLADLAHVQLRRERVEAGNLKRLGPMDRIVLDPPRAGAGLEVSRALAHSGAGRIAYLSCDAATLARDLAVFMPAGWTLRRLRAFDLFPMTEHVEVLALLDGPKGGRL